MSYFAHICLQLCGWMGLCFISYENLTKERRDSHRRHPHHQNMQECWENERPIIFFAAGIIVRHSATLK